MGLEGIRLVCVGWNAVGQRGLVLAWEGFGDGFRRLWVVWMMDLGFLTGEGLVVRDGVWMQFGQTGCDFGEFWGSWGLDFVVYN